ncbi:kinase-like domain-containing protein [Rhizophagus irregularis DAOM 181602=DAOM 197198]|nr:kinase-like domain-containing protein [Rhizophagus irregularis DAOM 181602=DAOM 197198]
MIVALKSKFIKKEGNSKTDTQLLDKFINDMKLHKKVDYHPNILHFMELVKVLKFEVVIISIALRYSTNILINPSFFKYVLNVTIEPNLNKYLLMMDYADGGTPWSLFKILVILIREGVIKISNFWIFKTLSETSKSSSDLKGYIMYIEPRSLKNSQYRRNDKSDVYSVGVLLWELSSGRPPFKSTSSSTSLTQLELANKISNGQRERPIKGTPQAYIDIYSQLLEKLNGITLENTTREKSWKSISEKKIKSNDSTTQKRRITDRKSISSISDISSDLIKYDESKKVIIHPKLPNSRRSSTNSINSPPTSPTTLTQNKKIIANTDKAFFEEILKFFEEILEISGDTNTMIQSLKEYLHNRMREHKSTFKSLRRHRDDLRFSCLIGFFFENAIDRKKAYELLKKSSDSGNSRGQWMLGYCYERGYGTTKNLQSAFDQFLASAEAGNVTSQMDLGRCYEDGIGIKKNIPKAIECYEKASKGGLALAQKKIG